MNELKTIIKNLKEAVKENNVEITGNCLFENAVKIYISDRINNKIESKLKNEEAPNNLLTDSQKYFLNKRKIDTNNLTKLEAGKIISEIKAKEQRDDRGYK
jgi:hypothetical protein